MTRGGVKSYFLPDGLDSTIQLADTSGQIQETYLYDVFGKVTIKNSSGTVIPQSNYGNRYLFTGRELDQETGLYHYRARTYHPTLGRFMQKDPWTRTADDPRLIDLIPVSTKTLNLDPTQPIYIGRTEAVDQVLHKFLTRNQRQPLGLHLYNYGWNNPINFIDPFGLERLGRLRLFPNLSLPGGPYFYNPHTGRLYPGSAVFPYTDPMSSFIREPVLRHPNATAKVIGTGFGIGTTVITGNSRLGVAVSEIVEGYISAILGGEVPIPIPKTPFSIPLNPPSAE